VKKERGGVELMGKRGGHYYSTQGKKRTGNLEKSKGGKKQGVIDDT